MNHHPPDPLAAYRDRFVIPDSGLIYLDGNSLGRPLRQSVEDVERALEAWQDRLIRGWDEWFDLPQRLGNKIARIIGAKEGEVVVADSTTVNLYKLVQATLQLRPERRVIVTDAANFPSDLYVLKSTGCEVRVVKDESEIDQAIDDQVALVSLSHVAFKSGEKLHAHRITRLAHEAGALILWDLSHSAGAVEVNLEAWGADLAVGCTYKYLNGGPGAPAYLYVRQEHQESMRSPIPGWFGHARPFDFSQDYSPAEGIARWQAGTPPILSMVAIEAGLDIILEVKTPSIVAKSQAQTDFLIGLADQHLHQFGFEVATPRIANSRGSHVSLAHPEAWRICQSLIHDERVIPDFRTPDNLRLGVAPLYTSYGDLEEAISRLVRVMTSRSYEKYEIVPKGVT